MIAQLGPTDRFPQFVHRADAARDSDKSVRQICEHAFAFVHAGDDMQFGEAAMRNLAADQRFRDHADNLAARFKTGIGYCAH